MPCASSSPRNSSTVTSCFGPECRSGASGRSRRITWAWQSTARISDDNGRSALAILGLELRGGEEALLELFHVRDPHDLVELLEGHQRVGAVDDLARIERFLEEREAALHAAQRTCRQHSRINHGGDTQVLQLLRGEE